MRSILFSAVLCAVSGLATVASAQQAPGFFASYDALDTFITDTTSARDYALLLNRLGGGDEYTVEEMVQLKRQLDGIFPVNFNQHLVFSQNDLGGGLSQEGRAYYSDETTGYLWFYLLLHDRGNEVVVVEFSFNTSAARIMDRF